MEIPDYGIQGKFCLQNNCMARGKLQTKKDVATFFDIVIIGSGSAGFSAAEVSASQGASVCVIDKGRLGGECPNWACIPTKSLLKSAKMYYTAKHKLSDYGVHATNVTFSYSRITARKDAVVDAITGNGKKMSRIAEELGITIVRGDAEFIDAHTIKVGSQNIKGKSILIATGADSFVPPIAGLAQVGFLFFKEAVSLKKQPSSIVIIGGGPVACEFATFFSYLGTKVTMLELGKTLLSREDGEISALAQKSLQAKGVQVNTNTKTLSVAKDGRRKRVTYQVGEQKRQTIIVDQVLVAAGKRANIETLNLKKAKIKTDDRGLLIVSDTLQTSVPHIFAAGDVAGRMQFTHAAHAQGYIAGVNMLKKSSRGMLKVDERVMPRVTFVDPEIASVGITAEEAKNKKMSILVAKFPVGALGRAVTEGEREGLIKIVVDKNTRQILGGHIIGAHAGEVIHEIALAMYTRIKIDDVASMIHAFPTFSEAVVVAASQI